LETDTCSWRLNFLTSAPSVPCKKRIGELARLTNMTTRQQAMVVCLEDPVQSKADVCGPAWKVWHE
jgi:hypothetical protein